MAEGRSDGTMVVADHLIDDLGPRFDSACHVGSRAVVAVAGCDNGVSPFEILPGGRLLLPCVVADATALTPSGRAADDSLRGNGGNDRPAGEGGHDQLDGSGSDRFTGRRSSGARHGATGATGQRRADRRRGLLWTGHGRAARSAMMRRRSTS